VSLDRCAAKRTLNTALPAAVVASNAIESLNAPGIQAELEIGELNLTSTKPG
jgi:hypothetical protein